MNDDIARLKAILSRAKRVVLFTGAGFSVPSGIPDFRSEGGIYEGKFAGMSAEYMLSHSCLTMHTELFFEFYKSKMLYPSARPNDAHLRFAELEREGKLLSTVTQNIDGLHQAAGAKRVWELHGSVHRNTCMKCGEKYGLGYIVASEGVPVCRKCGGVVRPDVVLFACISAEAPGLLASLTLSALAKTERREWSVKRSPNSRAR